MSIKMSMLGSWKSTVQDLSLEVIRVWEDEDPNNLNFTGNARAQLRNLDYINVKVKGTIEWVTEGDVFFFQGKGIKRDEDGKNPIALAFVGIGWASSKPDVMTFNGGVVDCNMLPSIQPNFEGGSRDFNAVLKRVQ